MRAQLYIVATPIGNYRDITLRAIDVLKNVDIIICEEIKPARRILAKYQIEKELFQLNEHNESDIAIELIKMLKSEGRSAALISDCGTPVFSDPGAHLTELAVAENIKITTVPGVSSLMTALSGAGIDVDRFYFYGWLSPKKDIRRQELSRLKRIKELIVFMDTPYRLVSLLRDVKSAFGARREIVLAFELTTEKEKFLRGSAGEIHKTAENHKLKGEFVLLVRNNL